MDTNSFNPKSPDDIATRLDELYDQAHLTDGDPDLCARVLTLLIESQRVMHFDSPWGVDIAAAIVDVDRGEALLALSRLRVALVGSQVIDPRRLAERFGR